MESISHPLQVKSNDKEAVGNYQVEHYTPKDAFNKGVKMFSATLLAAIVSIILPGVHFVSVPLGILAAPIVGVYFYSTRKGAPKNMTADFLCPECQARNHVAAPRIATHYECKCIQCHHDLRLVPL